MCRLIIFIITSAIISSCHNSDKSHNETSQLSEISISQIIEREGNEYLRNSDVFDLNFNQKLWSSVVEDLNGDGKNDDITVHSTMEFLKNEDKPSGYNLMICINGRCFEKKMFWSGGSYFGKLLQFKIIDIDKQDSFKELIISYADNEIEDPSTNHLIIRLLQNNQLTANDIFSTGYNNGQIRFLDGAFEVDHGRYPSIKGKYRLSNRYVEQVNLYEEPQENVDYSGMAACPYVYLVHENTMHYKGEILRYLNAKHTEEWQRLILECPTNKENKMIIKIAEEKDEITYVNAAYLKIGDKIIKPIQYENINKTDIDDDNYLSLKKGESLELVFNTEGLVLKDVSLNVKGYYIPIMNNTICKKK
jgi:hypothetical protein